jgi:hypothetical protein
MARTESKMNDLCVVCHTDTDYEKNQNINERNHYVEGAGQLCEKCYKKLYQ